MKSVAGIWLPDNEQHLVPLLEASPKIDGKGTYQLFKQNAALRFVRQWRCAIDCGAHVGLWAMLLAKRFAKVAAFEPAPAHLECLQRNLAGRTNVEVYNCALGKEVDAISLGLEPGSSGGTHIVNDQAQGIAMFPLDDFHIDNVDFIKIDVEGYELFVAQGGEQTIRRHKPVIVIEQKPKGLAERYGQRRFAALELLKTWGAEVQFEASGDYVLTWRT